VLLVAVWVRMARYVALLRAINVGGNRKILMADLRAVLAAIGYGEISTYLHSGNAVFTAAAQPGDLLARAISDGVFAGLGTRVQVLIRTSGELADVIARNPLRAEPANPSRFFVAFLSAAVARLGAQDEEPEVFGEDRVWIRGAEAYLWCPKGFSVLGLTGMIEKRFTVVATARNWNTVTRLAGMASLASA
jgi:uncharacterized protein (DUF1697 family)